MTEEKHCVAFICVQNAGRSQMAAAFARQKVKEKDLPVKIISGGTDPAEAIHDVVVKAMKEKGFDLSSNEPSFAEPGELDDCNYVITMGCSARGVCPATWDGTDMEWDLDDPAEAGIEKVREIRDEIEQRVDSLLEEIA
ncbi:low molecular weight phosphatase family protein [Candidatus Bipolaricaulota bacterium]|nr:low molecular weight phosphatase family protein [Candidatus Bipolaricaulota bacterium]